MTIYLMRHGEASSDGLTTRGARDARRIAENLRSRGARIARIDHSPTARTRATARIVADVFSGALLNEWEAIGADSPPALIASSLEHEAEEIVVVTHQPTIARLLLHLGIADELELGTASVTAVARLDARWQLAWHLAPSSL